MAENLIKNGINEKLLTLDVVNEEKIKLSQNGSFNHRHKGLAYRLMKVNKDGNLTPKKRNKHIVKQNILFNLIQNSRLKTRQKSLDYWLETKNNLNFKIKMRPYLESLKFFTLWNHRLIKLKKILFGFKDL